MCIQLRKNNFCMFFREIVEAVEKVCLEVPLCLVAALAMGRL